MLLGPRVTGEAAGPASSISVNKRANEPKLRAPKERAVGVRRRPLVPGFLRGFPREAPLWMRPGPAWAAGDRKAIAVRFSMKITPYVFAL